MYQRITIDNRNVMDSLLQMNVKDPTLDELSLINKTFFEVKVMLGDENPICEILFRLRNSYEILLHNYTSSRHLFAVTDRSLVNDPTNELFQIKAIDESDCLSTNEKELLMDAIIFIHEKYGNKS